MLRLEVIPYTNLDQRYELCKELNKNKRNKIIKSFSDLGNCFIIKHYTIDSNVRM